MPDFERNMRSLELHLAKNGEDHAFLRGKHRGMDQARWQVAGAAAALIVVFSLIRFAGGV